jgi:hypothetical protein
MFEKALCCLSLLRPNGQDTRYCAFYWSGNKAGFSDGLHSTVGRINGGAYQLFLSHPVVVPCLRPFLPVENEEEQRDRFWLVLDRIERVLYIAPAQSAQHFLVCQWGVEPQAPQTLRVASRKELDRLVTEALQRWISPDIIEDWNCSPSLKAWLDQHIQC